jgi:hypothetical protein
MLRELGFLQIVNRMHIIDLLSEDKDYLFAVITDKKVDFWKKEEMKRTDIDRINIWVAEHSLGFTDKKIVKGTFKRGMKTGIDLMEHFIKFQNERTFIRPEKHINPDGDTITFESALFKATYFDKTRTLEICSDYLNERQLSYLLDPQIPFKEGW